MFRRSLISVIDLFYPLLRRWMPLQTFRYAACGGANTLLGLFIYSFSFTFLLNGNDLQLGFYAFKPHVAALFVSFSVNFPIGFILMRYIVFEESTVRGRIQLFRYFILFVFCLFLNYVLLKMLVELLEWNAIVSQVLTTGIVITVSYLSQKHFTFRVEKKEEDFPF